ncbi:MAG: beta-ketoacyl synthase N-terminal-like domain-containing protein [Polyangiaceae bacterium]
MNTLAVVVGAGARTSVGLTARHTAFLLRCGAAGFHETPLLDLNEEPVTIGTVPVIDPLLVGADRVRLLAEAALGEALASLGDKLPELRLRIVLGLDERLGVKVDGAPTAADTLAADMNDRARKRGVGAVVVEAVARGEASAGLRLKAACDELAAGGVDVVLLGGAHSDYDPPVLQRLSEQGRLFGSGCINGIIPGECAAFVVLCAAGFARKHDLPVRSKLHGIGQGFEKANPDNDLPSSPAQGLTLAMKQATASLLADKVRAGWILTDMTAEMHRIHEFQSVFVRAQPVLGNPQWIDAHAHRLGQLGAAALPLHAAIAATNWRHGFGPHGLALSMVGSDSGERVVTVWGEPGDGQSVQSPLWVPAEWEVPAPGAP